MILFAILLCALIAIAVVTISAAIIGGGSLVILFGDIFVFSLIIWLFVKIFRRKKK